MKTKIIARLQVITQDLPDRSHALQAEQACKGGARWIQFRMKAERADKEKSALDTLAVCRKYGAQLIINDDAELAAKIAADGVHLGKTDTPLDAARQMLGPDAILGATANSWTDIQQILLSSADYIGLGPFRFTATKENLSPVLGIEGYRFIFDKTGARIIPILAIGGIQLADTQALLQTGVQGIAVSSAILKTDDPVAATEAFIEHISKYSNPLYTPLP
jgi:thiamine-phosphate pyrophosphorylase